MPRLLAVALIVLLAGAAPAAEPDGGQGELFQRAALDMLTAPWTGDLDGMIERRLIRVLVVYNKTNYFLDGPTERGISYETLKLFETQLNETLRSRRLEVHLALIPVAHDELLPMLAQGRGDIAAAMLTRTELRGHLVDFSEPFTDSIRELVVTSPGGPKIERPEDLGGKKVFVRRSSSYYESLQSLNRKLEAKGLAPAIIEPAEEYLETEDILEMVNAELIQVTVADSQLAYFWKQIFTDIQVRDGFDLRSGGKIAWAFRKDSPRLAAAINAFVAKNKRGTLMGNMLFKRYLQDTQWARRAISGQDLERFKATIAFFKEYAGKYSFDWLMITALAYQESGLDQQKRSPEGAVGVMQILPSTAAAPPVLITGVTKLDKNIHAGVKYLRFIYDQNFKDDQRLDELNRVLFTFASYNAGPAKLAQLRDMAGKMGLDPNVWFGNVEVATAKVIGRETVRYVSNIAKYYIAYKQIASQAAMRPRPEASLR